MKQNFKPVKNPTLGERVRRIEEWIDLWETYDSGWTKYRTPLSSKKPKPRRNPKSTKRT